MSRIAPDREASKSFEAKVRKRRRTLLHVRDTAKTRCVLFAVAVTTAALLVGAGVPVRINWTASAPVGIYSTQAAIGVSRNDLVEVCLQGSVATLGRVRGYLAPGTCPNGVSPVLKRVVAVAGDHIELQRIFVAVNGRVIDRSQRHSMDSLGRPLRPVAFGRRVVRDDEVWVLGVHRQRSWDSRYFGPIPVSSIAGIVRPLLTLSAEPPL
ncbi:MAG: conjugal transfer protein TraF [Proteobacteria bacterium]|nr:MAG: conjugal transfer protein TraF [Pseudomonadota bacterium]